MPIELPIGWTIFLNVVGWLVIQMGLAWAFTKMPVAWFKPADVWSWEHAGHFYESFFRIRGWKASLPDGARWFGGVPKGFLVGKDHECLRRFLRETWRGELCHWAAIGCAPLFFQWNPWWGDLIILTYALGANLPCILVQRYNRARLLRRLLKAT